MFALALPKILLEGIFDLFYFPIWWYTAGALRAVRWCHTVFMGGNENLAPGIWLRNIFVPMFGQYDWQGRIISFVMRLIQVIIRSVALLVWIFVCVILFIGYLAIPAVISWGFFHGFSNSSYGAI